MSIYIRTSLFWGGGVFWVWGGGGESADFIFVCAGIFLTPRTKPFKLDRVSFSTPFKFAKVRIQARQEAPSHGEL